MRAWIASKPILLLVAAGALALGTGFLAATAFGTGSQAPSRTVTVTLTNGEQGPTGPAGPPGPAGEPGAESCPPGYEFGAVVFNTPGGHQQIATCLQTP